MLSFSIDVFQDAEAQVKFEDELRHHLARQAAAHSDHLKEVLAVQERELNVKFQVRNTEEC